MEDLSRRIALQDDNKLSLSTKKPHHNLYSRYTILEDHIYEIPNQSRAPKAVIGQPSSPT